MPGVTESAFLPRQMFGAMVLLGTRQFAQTRPQHVTVGWRWVRPPFSIVPILITLGFQVESLLTYRRYDVSTLCMTHRADSFSLSAPPWEWRPPESIPRFGHEKSAMKFVFATLMLVSDRWAVCPYRTSTANSCACCASSSASIRRRKWCPGKRDGGRRLRDSGRDVYRRFRLDRFASALHSFILVLETLVPHAAVRLRFRPPDTIDAIGPLGPIFDRLYRKGPEPPINTAREPQRHGPTKEGVAPWSMAAELR
jgi:hypothetical protein